MQKQLERLQGISFIIWDIQHNAICTFNCGIIKYLQWNKLFIKHLNRRLARRRIVVFDLVRQKLRLSDICFMTFYEYQRKHQS